MAHERVEVVAIEPGLLDEGRAAEFLARSTSWLRATRQADHSAIARGEAPSGPAWIVIGKSVFYQPNDLRQWIADRATLRGKVEFRNRGRSLPSTRERAP